MFGKFSMLFRVLQSGSELGDKQFWKKQQAYSVPVVAGVLVSCIQLAKAFGVEIPLDESTCMYIAGVLYAAVNFWLTIATSKHIGLPVFGKGCSSESHVQGIAGAAESIVEACAEVRVDNIIECVRDVAETAIAANAGKLANDALTSANDWFKRNR